MNKQIEQRFASTASVMLSSSGARMFRGDVLFALKATHGLPLDFALDRLVTDEGMSIDWIGFIEAARSGGWWDFQTYDAMCHGIEDAQLPKDHLKSARDGFKRYVLAFPHPRMTYSASVAASAA